MQIPRFHEVTIDQTYATYPCANQGLRLNSAQCSAANDYGMGLSQPFLSVFAPNGQLLLPLITLFEKFWDDTRWYQR